MLGVLSKKGKLRRVFGLRSGKRFRKGLKLKPLLNDNF